MTSIKTLTFILALMVLTGGLSSCKDYRKFKEARAELNETNKERKKAWKEAKKERKKAKEEEGVVVEEVPTDEMIVAVDSLGKKEIGDSLYITFERTACFGRCPIYKLRIFDSGFATYQGINFVERMGVFHTRYTIDQLAEIENYLEEADFYNLKDSYDNPNISDLPSKIMVVNKYDQKKRVKGRYQVPDELISLFDKMDQWIENTDWKPGDGQ